MPTGAIYSKATGIIQQTISPPLSNKEQLAAMDAAGIAQVVIPDGKNGGHGIINLETGEYVDYMPPPPPPPDIMLQYIAAQLKAGNVSTSDFHPASISELNAVLSTADMATVDAQIVAGDTKP